MTLQHPRRRRQVQQPPPPPHQQRRRPPRRNGAAAPAHYSRPPPAAAAGRRLCPRHLCLLVTAAVVVAFLAVPAAAAATGRTKRKNGNPLARTVRVFLSGDSSSSHHNTSGKSNHSGSNHIPAAVDVFWIHPDTGALAESNIAGGEGIVPGGETGLATYVGHSFLVLELPSVKTKRCRRPLCRKAYFTVNSNEEQCAYSSSHFVCAVCIFIFICLFLCLRGVYLESRKMAATARHCMCSLFGLAARGPNISCCFVCLHFVRGDD